MVEIKIDHIVSSAAATNHKPTASEFAVHFDKHALQKMAGTK